MRKRNPHRSRVRNEEETKSKFVSMCADAAAALS